MIVADTNLVAYLLVPGEKSELAEAVLRKDAEWASPLLCRSELRNVLALCMRHQGMSLAQAQQTMNKAERILKRHEFVVSSDAVLELTSQTALSAYDAEFVVLANQLDIPLITFDKAVLQAFPQSAIHPEVFTSSRARP